jgi:hypothetical protein
MRTTGMKKMEKEGGLETYLSRVLKITRLFVFQTDAMG